MPKAMPINDSEGKPGGHVIECPACGNWHLFSSRDSERAKQGGPSWEFNGDLEKPTFSPSMLVYGTNPDGSRRVVCHSYVQEGRIRFLDDCPHSLSGQTVDLPDLNQENP